MGVSLIDELVDVTVMLGDSVGVTGKLVGVTVMRLSGCDR